MRISLKPHRLWTRRRTNIIKSSTTISFSWIVPFFQEKEALKLLTAFVLLSVPLLSIVKFHLERRCLDAADLVKCPQLRLKTFFSGVKASSPTTESFLKIVSEKWKPSFPLYLILHPVTDGLGSQKRTEEKEEPLLSFLPKKVSKCIRKLLREERHKSCLSETISATK